MSAAFVKGESMKKLTLYAAVLFLSAVLASCSDNADYSAENLTTTEITAAVATTTTAEPTTEQVTAPQQEVGFDGMKPISADAVKDGEYDINVDSSSSMFKITECKLTVADGKMTAKITMSGSGYEYLFMGSGEEAEKADENKRIKAEAEGDVVKFTIPVEALDKKIDCAAFSKRKEQWYDRKLVFRADSLPSDALTAGAFTTLESLSLENGEYLVDVRLEGGSGKASVKSPAKLTVSDGTAVAEIIWSSNKYDYMVVNGEKIEPKSMDEFSIFEVPVTGFDYRMPVSADTTAMSTPHEIEYTLYFDSSSIKK